MLEVDDNVWACVKYGSSFVNQTFLRCPNCLTTKQNRLESFKSLSFIASLQFRFHATTVISSFNKLLLTKVHKICFLKGKFDFAS